MTKYENVVRKLQDFRMIVQEIISNACYGALLNKGFVVDETLEDQGLFLA